MNTSTIKWLIVIAFSLILNACSESLRVMSVNLVKDSGDALVYNLPRTALIIEAEIEKTVNFKGPFAEYTDLYFQSNRTVMRNETSYRLKNIRISSAPVPDSSQYYAILLPNGETKGAQISLTEHLFPVAINSDTETQSYEFNELIVTQDTEARKPDYADLSIQSVRETVYDTVYTDVFRDSVFVKVPKVYTRKQFKSPEKQAKEMAEQIFRLRDDRLALLKGVTDANNFPDGNAVKLMIEELDKYERQYMNMFTGQTTVSTEMFRYVYIPDDSDSKVSKVLFRFSPQFGILPENLEQGVPVVLNLEKSKQHIDLANYRQFMESTQLQKKKQSYGFAYRIPGQANAEIVFGKDILFKNMITLAQFGLINRLPIELISDPNIETVFRPHLGAVKRISRKQQ